MSERLIDETWFRMGDLWDSCDNEQRSNLLCGSDMDDVNIEFTEWNNLKFSQRLHIYDFVLNTAKTVIKTTKEEGN